MLFTKLYINLCERGKLRINEYSSKSGLHEHHIIPKHSGGTDVTENLSYLTVREHITAHYLLWRINRNPNDLRSMHMLGAELTYEQRRTVGLFCKENRIGWFGMSEEDKNAARLKGFNKQKEMVESGIVKHNSFYYWSTKEGRKERASLGGKVGGKTARREGKGFHNPEKRSEYASLGGKALAEYVCVHHPEKTGFTRIPRNKLTEYLKSGFRFGAKTINFNNLPLTGNRIRKNNRSFYARDIDGNIHRIPNELKEYVIQAGYSEITVYRS